MHIRIIKRAVKELTAVNPQRERGGVRVFKGGGQEFAHRPFERFIGLAQGRRFPCRAALVLPAGFCRHRFAVSHESCSEMPLALHGVRVEPVHHFKGKTFVLRQKAFDCTLVLFL